MRHLLYYNYVFNTHNTIGASEAPHRRYKHSQSTYYYHYYGTYVTRAPLYVVYISALFIPVAA